MGQQKQENLKTQRAFYSLVQYCPDLSRLEVANIGVVVFCEELDFLGTRMTQNHTRINQMFGRGQRDLKRLKTVKAGLQEKLSSKSGNLRTLEHLNQLAALHVNTIRMSKFMPCRVSEDPSADVQRLFKELVEDETDAKPLSKKEALHKDLETRFSKPEIEIRLRRKISVHIPVLDRKEEIPFGYQNGRFNLIAPVVFPRGKSALEDRSAKYAVEGKSLFDTPNDQFGALQLLVVGHFDQGSDGGIEAATRILSSHDVRLVSSKDLSKLEHEIVTQGHVVT